MFDCINTHESRATWYAPRSCIWLRVTLHGGPTASRLLLEGSFKDSEPQRYSRTTETPRNEEEVTTFSPGVAQKLPFSSSGVSGDVPPAFRQGQGHPRKQRHLSAFLEVSVSGIVTATILNWG